MGPSYKLTPPEARVLATLKAPFQAPNANALSGRFVRSIKDECLDRMILLGEGDLRRALEEHHDHDHSERNHQGSGRAVSPDTSVSLPQVNTAQSHGLHPVMSEN